MQLLIHYLYPTHDSKEEGKILLLKEKKLQENELHEQL
jgi:hypothetical protein